MRPSGLNSALEHAMSEKAFPSTTALPIVDLGDGHTLKYFLKYRELWVREIRHGRTLECSMHDLRRGDLYERTVLFLGHRDEVPKGR
jgi:hypothetical protein